MKLWFMACLSFALMGCATTSFSEPANADNRPQIMVLGTHHFTGGGYDYVNPEVDDYLAPERQKEILDVVKRLAAFEPSKIALEVNPDQEASFNEIYQAYLNGAHELGVSERQQIGFRLAALMEHSKIYAIDFRNGGMDIGGMFELGEKTGQTEILEYLADLRERTTELDAAMNAKSITIRERLVHENGEDVRKAHNVYLTLAQIGEKPNMLGAQEMGKWWSRNLHIFANISLIAEPDDRILVIFGSGHKFLLDQFIADSHEFILTDPRDVLEADN